MVYNMGKCRVLVAISGVLAMITAIIHMVIGGAESVKPLFVTTELPLQAQFTLYYAWHIVSITLTGMALALGLAAWRSRYIVIGWFAAGGALMFALWDWVMIVIFSLDPWLFGQWILFLAIASCAAIGLKGMTIGK